MNKKNKILLTLAGGVTLLIIIMIQTGIFSTGKISPGKGISKSDSISGNKITVKEIEIPVIYHAVGTIRSRTEVELSSRITARITEIKVRSGDKISKDQVLIELDKSNLKAKLKQAQERLNETKSAIKSASQEINKTKAAFTLAESTLTRDKGLFEKKIIPKKVLEESTSRFDQASSSLNQAEQYKIQANSAMEAALGNIKEVEANLSYATIKSPFSGIAAKRLADPGDLASPGIILMTIFDPTRIMFYVPISESLVNKVKVGKELPITVPAIGKTVNSQIREIVPSVDPDSRTFLVKVCILKNNSLMPGMFGTLNLQVGKEKAIIIPKSAVTKVGQLEYVNLYKNNTIQKQLIRSVKYKDNQVKIISGLKPGNIIYDLNSL